MCRIQSDGIRTVGGRVLHTTYWPEVLRTDSGLHRDVSKPTAFVSRLVPATTLLVTIAGIVTPLGLYEGLWQTSPTVVPFQYAADSSVFGRGTPSRSSLGFNRRCGLPVNKPCPMSDMVASYTTFDNGTVGASYSGGTYDLRIPQILQDTYSSGTKDNTTLSNFFDIQWRQYITRTESGSNDGSAYLVGSLRQVQSRILGNDIQPVEGLVVDMVDGRIGFRNHTVPTGSQLSATWTEDILFVEPETACVNTNLTIDFTVTTNGSIRDLVLTDRGGFASLNHTYPSFDQYAAQDDPDLKGRAYKAAWMSNAWTMLYWNITNPTDTATRTKAWSYLDSFVGKRYRLNNDNQTAPWNSLQLDSKWTSYNGLGRIVGLADVNYKDLNPFKMTSSNFSDISALSPKAFSFQKWDCKLTGRNRPHLLWRRRQRSCQH